MEEKFINAEQLAQVLGISKSGVFALVNRGYLPSGYRLGHCRRWLLSEVRKWLDAQKGILE